MRLFNDFVCAAEHHGRQLKAKRPRGLEIDDQFVFGRRLHWQVGRLFTLEDAPGIDSGLIPSAFAVARLIARSTGFAPLSILST